MRVSLVSVCSRCVRQSEYRNDTKVRSLAGLGGKTLPLKCYPCPTCSSPTGRTGLVSGKIEVCMLWLCGYVNTLGEIMTDWECKKVSKVGYLSELCQMGYLHGWQCWDLIAVLEALYWLTVCFTIDFKAIRSAFFCFLFYNTFLLNFSKAEHKATCIICTQITQVIWPARITSTFMDPEVFWLLPFNHPKCYINKDWLIDNCFPTL